jgi:hypothetical protein
MHPWRRDAAAPEEEDAATRRTRLVLVCAGAALAGVAIWSAVLLRGDGGVPVERGAVAEIGAPGRRATSVATDGGTIWTIGLLERRLRGLSAASAEPIVTPPVGASGDLATTLATADGAVWVALKRAGTGAVVRVDPDGGRRVYSTGDLLPDHIVVLPARIVVLNANRLASIPTRGARRWSQPSPGAIDVDVGYGSIWVLSRIAGGRSLITRRDLATGRVVGRRGAPAAATAIAVGLGAVWVANGCPNGVLRAPAGPGPATCVRVGKGPADIAVGGGSAWAADAARRRVVELDGATGAMVRAWVTPDPPASLAVGARGVVALTRRGDTLLLRDTEPPGSAEPAPVSS